MIFGLFKNAELSTVAEHLHSKTLAIKKVLEYGLKNRKFDKDPSLAEIVMYLDKNKINHQRYSTTMRQGIEIELGTEENFRMFDGLTMKVNIHPDDGDYTHFKKAEYKIITVGINDYHGFWLEYSTREKKIIVEARDIFKLLKMDIPGKALTKKAVALKKEIKKLI